MVEGSVEGNVISQDLLTPRFRSEYEAIGLYKRVALYKPKLTVELCISMLNIPMRIATICRYSMLSPPMERNG